MNIRIADERFCTVSPSACTVAGSSALAVCTRFSTLTVLTSGLVPSWKLTVRLYDPSLPLTDRM